MATARPRIVTRLIENTDTSVMLAMVRRTAIEPRMESTPTSSGRKAAVRPPNTTSRSRKSTGAEMISAVLRSRSIFSLA